MSGTAALTAWLDPAASPRTMPPRARMGAATRHLHDALDDHARRSGAPYLHPDEPTIQQDLFGSARVIAWQEAKAASLFADDGCWSELPPLYARYGTAATRRLIARVRALEAAAAAVVVDSGMQATALVFDTLMTPGASAVVCRQVYNKTKTYLRWLAERLGGTVTVVDDGDHAALAAAIAPHTRIVFAETYTNPLMRAQDIPALVGVVAEARRRTPDLALVIDSTIATPWGVRTPLLTRGVDIVVASGTKALGGSDRDLWGYVATRETARATAVMDLVAMRGGILDWRRAEAVVKGLDQAESAHRQRSTTATKVAAFLAAHPRVAEVFHPSLPTHPDATVIARDYQRPGSLVTFRVSGANEAATRHVADVVAMTGIIRYALSFDGLATKINHHQSVSEYFTPRAELVAGGLDRLIRLGIGLEEPDDLIAALNWALHHADAVGADDIETWQAARAAELSGNGCRE